MYTLLGSIAIYLNNNLTDPLIDRQGSYVFGPDMEINTKKYMPKCQVTDAFIDDPADYSFGPNPRSTKTNVVSAVYYAKRNDKYTENSITYKDRSLVYLFLSKIQDTIGSATGSFIGMNIPRFGKVDRIGYDKNNQYYMGVLPFAFKYRE